MSRRRRSHNNTRTYKQRDATDITNGFFTSPLLSSKSIRLKSSALADISDSRRWKPPRVRSLVPPRTVRGRVAKIKPRFLPSRLTAVFSLPRDAIICARRKIRKQVLFAKGKGGANHKRRHKYTKDSQFRC